MKGRVIGIGYISTSGAPIFTGRILQESRLSTVAHRTDTSNLLEMIPNSYGEGQLVVGRKKRSNATELNCR